ncbi:acetyl-CoA carboxylase biotin carboxyl carrier protein [Jeotgalibacillus aurantiacus]|uniref:acetyl-CoA carboxylase biotin carboxyl carrier protein n=1 Tax=Jeotgalibacillus aurantiacus TaxID=2763266 RepID=UPI001D0A7C77|nr:acetyl-CoA carboxylase biotin carboxyl carrier protein [Jeotgalibacillus aurantiacus]
MLKVQEIRELIKLIDKSSIDEFTYEQDGAKIKMRKQSNAVVHQVEQVVTSAPEQTAPVQQAPVQETAPAAVQEEKAAAPAVETPSLEGTVEIKSPMVGTFYEASSPDADPFVKVGSKVSKDTPVCIVEAMKLFNEIEAEVDGEIVEVLVKNGQLVEYGQPLFLVKE